MKFDWDGKCLEVLQEVKKRNSFIDYLEHLRDNGLLENKNNTSLLVYADD